MHICILFFIVTVFLINIRGKGNLKKFAKILDLDVCEKSLKKRKDNSVHELGSRRSKKRKKLEQEAHDDNYDEFAAHLLFNLSSVPPPLGI